MDGLIWLPEGHWDWKIIVYLFFGGLAGGAYLTGLLADVMGYRSSDESLADSMRDTTRWGMLAAIVAIAVGGIVLFSHLGAPLRALLFPVLFVNFGSWLVIGTYTLILFTLIAVIQLFWLVWGHDDGERPSMFLRQITGWIEETVGLPIDTWLARLATWSNPGTTGRLAVHVVGAFFSVLLVVYTALLLSDVSWLVPAWDGTLLPFLFLASGLSIGMAATAGLTVVFEGLEGTRITTFSLIDDAVILFEIVVLALLVSALASGGPASLASYELLMNDYALLFWGGVVAVGLVLPLVLSGALLVVERQKDVHGDDGLRKMVRRVYTTKFTFVVLGGLALRFLALMMGVSAPLAAPV
ncbi:anaerobic dehydrogenase transmembrane subunit [Natronobacterium gregoryi SP2]|nr:anaerobic dehydrogenase transmembrane subunit [Natronobacterium gregoryi SP2]